MSHVKLSPSPKRNLLHIYCVYRNFRDNWGDTGYHCKAFAIFLSPTPITLLPPSQKHISSLYHEELFPFLKPWSLPQVDLLRQFLNKGGPLPKVNLTLASKRIKMSLFNYVYYFKSSQKSCKVCPFSYVVHEEIKTERWNASLKLYINR